MAKLSKDITVQNHLYKYMSVSLVVMSAILSSPIMGNSVMAQEVDEVISADDLRPHIKTLASDAYEGRKPGTEGGVKTAYYLAKQWFDAGYVGGAKDGSFYQTVPLVSRIPQSAIVSFYKKSSLAAVKNNEIALIGNESEVNFTSPTIFGGYGVKKDGSAIDNVAGKAVFILASDPPFLSGDGSATNERIDALTKAGASSVVIIIAEEANWERFSRFLSARPVSLQSRNSELRVNGLASFNYGKALMRAVGLNWKDQLKRAESGDFNGTDLGANSNWNVRTQVDKYNSYNVIAKLPGAKSDAGAVFFTGHWDHLGICAPVGAEDRICNGAIDNASGMAVLIEVSKHLAKQKFDRDIYFVGTTAEESGLLGAYYMVDNPPIDIKDIVIALNVDTIAIAPKGAKVAIIGRGTTDLDPIIEKVATDLGRGIESSTDANAFIRRQDGWALASKGVPALMVGGSFADLDLLGKFLSGDYHGPNDEYSETTELGGAAEDAVLHLRLAEYFANIATYNGNKASE